MGVKLEVARGNFTGLGGLYLFEQVFEMFGLRQKLKDFLPTPDRRGSTSSYARFKALVLGFIAGAENLDDMEKLREDPGFVSFCGDHVNAAIVYGNFLRNFEIWQFRKLNEVLGSCALTQRRMMFPEDPDFILDIDSTSHEQHGRKMEGLAYNYASVWGLSSLQAFDQYGFQYWMDTREGNTNTSVGVVEALRSVFRRVPKKMHRYFRADSGMCNHDVFSACYDMRVDFVIAMRANMYEPLIPRVNKWHRAKEIKMSGNRDCDIGSCVYYGSKGRQALRIVFLRAKKPQGELKLDDGYDYVAWVTNLGEHTGMSNEGIIKFYRGRGNAENFIRELKNGLDLHHFPCQKLLANKIYGVIASFAYNLQRMASWQLSPNKPRFSKMLRFRMVHLAGQVVRKARMTIIRLSETHIKELETWLNMFRQKKLLLTG